LPDGAEFDAPAGLKKLLVAKYREDFVTTATEKLLTYALGRGLEYYDMPAVRSITREAARGDYRISALIAGVGKGTPIQMKRAQEQCPPSRGTICPAVHSCAASARLWRFPCWIRWFPLLRPPTARKRLFGWASCTIRSA